MSTIQHLLRAGLLAIAGLLGAGMSQAATLGYADIVIDYFDSGAGPLAGPYGGMGGIGGPFPVAVSTAVVVGSDVAGSETFLSLPTGSYVTVGFVDESVIDGVGNDIFIQEIGGAGERAEVYVSKDGLSFVLLGIAIDNVTTALDLAAIGFTDAVTAIRIVGLDSGGGSPGFDVVNVQVLPGSIRVNVPEPYTLALVGLALAACAGASRRRR